MDSAVEYEKNAHDFLAERDGSLVGYKVVRKWARKLRDGSEVIEIARGGGYPFTKELFGAGLKLWAIDSSKTLLVWCFILIDDYRSPLRPGDKAQCAGNGSPFSRSATQY